MVDRGAGWARPEPPIALPVVAGAGDAGAAWLPAHEYAVRSVWQLAVSQLEAR
jgi:hypothetical protein